MIPFGFASFIHGHNHHNLSDLVPTPRTGYPIRRLSVPTLSERRGTHNRAYVRWEPPAEPKLIELAG